MAATRRLLLITGRSSLLARRQRQQQQQPSGLLLAPSSRLRRARSNSNNYHDRAATTRRRSVVTTVVETGGRRSPILTAAAWRLPSNNRFFSSGGADDDDGNGKEIKKDDVAGDVTEPSPPADDKKSTTSAIDGDDDDPFGVHFQDGSGRLGPTLPPQYRRDAATGRFTGEIEPELTADEERVLSADPLEKDRLLLRRVREHWERGGTDDGLPPLPAELDRLGARVREADAALNVLGRSTAARAAREELDDDGSTAADDDTHFSRPLTESEFKSFAAYMEKKHKIKVTEQDIPVQQSSGSRRGRATKKEGEEVDEDPDLTLKWMTARAQRQMDDLLSDNPFSDLMPGDLTPHRLVNRRRAKQIPVGLLHHNNVALLRHFVTPTGQIRNRVQTRLGARDQRRVARLIRRARCLGLIPYQGQFKVERHGWVHAPDIREDRPWEKELKRRGLEIQARRQRRRESNNKEQEGSKQLS